MILHAVFLAWLGEYDATNLHCFLRFCVRVHRLFVDWSGIGFLFVGEVCAKQIFPSFVSTVKLSQFLDLPVDLGVLAKELKENNNRKIKIKNFFKNINYFYTKLN